VRTGANPILRWCGAVPKGGGEFWGRVKKDSHIYSGRRAPSFQLGPSKLDKQEPDIYKYVHGCPFDDGLGMILRRERDVHRIGSTPRIKIPAGSVPSLAVRAPILGEIRRP
jgi:hypothetical protein